MSSRTAEAGSQGLGVIEPKLMLPRVHPAKYAGRTAQVTLRLDHHDEALRVRIADDGRGFDPARTPEGAGLQNICDRIVGFGRGFRVASRAGFGTVLAISLPWPAAADGRR